MQARVDQYQAAKSLGFAVPPKVLALADEAIEYHQDVRCWRLRLQPEADFGLVRRNGLLHEPTVLYETLSLVIDGLQAIDRRWNAFVARFELQGEELRVMA